LRGLFLQASRQRHKLQADSGIVAGTPGGPGTVNWTPIGPSVIKSGVIESGRITSIVVGPGGTRI
jgi:hypothetical protein